MKDMNREDDAYALRPAWTKLSSERQAYLDLFQDYIPRGQLHFKLRREYGFARLSMRSMEALQKAALGGDQRAQSMLAGDLSAHGGR